MNIVIRWWRHERSRFIFCRRAKFLLSIDVSFHSTVLNKPWAMLFVGLLNSTRLIEKTFRFQHKGLPWKMHCTSLNSHHVSKLWSYWYMPERVKSSSNKKKKKIIDLLLNIYSNACNNWFICDSSVNNLSTSFDLLC